MGKRNDWFDDLMGQYARQLDRAIRRDDELWRDRVPESLDRRIAALAAAPAGAAALPAAKEPPLKGAAAGRTLRLLALAAAVTVGASAGTCAALPAVREAVAAVCVRREETKGLLEPGDYVIPSPGEGYTVTDEAGSRYMQARWFTSEDRELLVQIADELPPGTGTDAGGEPAAVDGVAGTYRQEGPTQVLVLYDGAAVLRLEAWGADRDELMEYAAALLAANHREETK